MLVAFFSLPSWAYYGLKSQEATLEFVGEADIPLEGEVSLAQINDSGNVQKALALKQIHLQIRHLMGSLQSKYFTRKFPYRGLLGENYEIRFLSLAKGSGNGRYRVSYEFSGKVIFEKELFTAGAAGLLRSVPIVMPLQADKIFKLSQGKQSRNRCMPLRIVDEDEFWYYWDPSLPGCPLLEKGKPTADLFVGEGRLTPIPNTRYTCPQYQKLYTDKPLKIAIFYGYLSELKKHKRTNYNDLNYQSMTAFEDVLENKWGFTKDRTRWRSGFSATGKKGVAHLHTWLGEVQATDRSLADKVKVEIQILLSDTDLDAGDPTFHAYIKPALQEYNIIVYDGHAGDERNLNLNSPALGFSVLPKDLYQIFFFNGCYTYPYFNGMYFKAKGGNANMEIVTSGQETDSRMGVKNMVDFLEPFVFAKSYTYQTILQRLERRIPKSYGVALYGVNGDEGKLCHSSSAF